MTESEKISILFTEKEAYLAVLGFNLVTAYIVGSPTHTLQTISELERTLQEGKITKEDSTGLAQIAVNISQTYLERKKPK